MQPRLVIIHFLNSDHCDDTPKLPSAELINKSRLANASAKEQIGVTFELAANKKALIGTRNQWESIYRNKYLCF